MRVRSSLCPPVPLSASTTYQVAITASDILGTLQSLSWNFTTGTLKARAPGYRLFGGTAPGGARSTGMVAIRRCAYGGDRGRSARTCRGLRRSWSSARAVLPAAPAIDRAGWEADLRGSMRASDRRGMRNGNKLRLLRHSRIVWPSRGHGDSRSQSSRKSRTWRWAT